MLLPYEDKESLTKIYNDFAKRIDERELKEDIAIHVHCEYRRKHAKRWLKYDSHIKQKSRAKDSLRYFIFNKVQDVRNVWICFESCIYASLVVIKQKG